MHNFVAHASENPWLADADLTRRTNATLAAKRARFEEARASGAFWAAGATPADRAALAPEVRSVEWLPMKQAAWMLLTSKSERLTPVNDFQAREFERLGIGARDPMFQTFASLMEVESCGSGEQALLEHCAAFQDPGERERAEAAERERFLSKRREDGAKAKAEEEDAEAEAPPPPRGSKL